MIAFDIVDTGVLPWRLRSVAELIQRYPEGIAQDGDGAGQHIARIAASLGGYLSWTRTPSKENILTVHLPLVANTGVAGVAAGEPECTSV